MTDLLIGAAIGAVLMSLRANKSVHEATIERGPSLFDDVYLHHDTTEGIPQSKRCLPSSYSYTHTDLGYELERRNRIATRHKLASLMQVLKPQETPRHYIPSSSDLPVDETEGTITAAVKAAKLPDKSSGDIDSEIHRAQHREYPELNS